MSDIDQLAAKVDVMLDAVNAMTANIDTEHGTVLSQNVRNLLVAASNAVAKAKTDFDNRNASDAINKRLDEMQSAIESAKEAVEKSGVTAQIDEGLFSGEHAAGAAHKLPIHNMVESSFISEASGYEYQAEILRFMGGSGMLGARQYTASSGFDPLERPFDAAYACLNMHDHANYNGQPGSAEYAAILNGYYVRTRHNDYKLMHPIQGEYEDRDYTYSPAIRADILALPTGVNNDDTLDIDSDTQARYMSNIYTENKADLEWHLSYFEMWLEYVDGDSVDDPADSFRHSNVSDSMRELFEKGVYLNASGHKNRLENLPFQNTFLRIVSATGTPTFARIKYRISTYPVGNFADIDDTNRLPPKVFVGTGDSHQHTIDTQMTKEQADMLIAGSLSEVILVAGGSHTHDIRITYVNGKYVAEDLNESHQHTLSIDQEFSGNVPYDREKAKAGTVDETNRFVLVREPRSLINKGSLDDLIDSRMARFRCADLERMCEKLPGLNGVGATLLEEYDQYGLSDELQDRDGGLLNSAYYSRRYTYAYDDASGRRTADRGFNDPTLWAAKTTHEKVVGGFSYMVPLEMILRTPRENWNPYDLQEVDSTTLKAEEAANKGGSSTTAFSGINENHFFLGTPYAFYGDANTVSDPADTRQEAWVLDASSVARRVWARGVRVFDKSGERRRFPVYPVFHEYSHANVQLENMKLQLKSLLEKSAAGTLTQQDIDDAL